MFDMLFHGTIANAPIKVPHLSSELGITIL